MFLIHKKCHQDDGGAQFFFQILYGSLIISAKNTVCENNKENISVFVYHPDLSL